MDLSSRNKKSKLSNISFFLFAICIGSGLFIMKESEIISYASDDPQVCVNCHVMVSEYNSWMHSSHREWASCNDCHTPQDNVFNKYYFKAKDGVLHASIFTARMEPQVIRMREESEEVVKANCIRCHTNQITQVKYTSWLANHYSDRTDRKCWECHREVVHGRVHGISSIKYNISPLPTDVLKTIVPKWLEKEIKK